MASINLGVNPNLCIVFHFVLLCMKPYECPLKSQEGCQAVFLEGQVFTSQISKGRGDP